MTALTRRLPAALPDIFRNSYAPGTVRRSTDSEHEAVARFVDRHPEYRRLSHIELVTLAATYRGEEREMENAVLLEGGVPVDWHRDADDDDFYDEVLA